jgi:hypothetical protein
MSYTRISQKKRKIIVLNSKNIKNFTYYLKVIEQSIMENKGNFEEKRVHSHSSINMIFFDIPLIFF